ncbi:phosphoadenosine phosphosulfate reductase family protein [Moraxella catarrhalis]|uniref:phosphoadenosine phosphosulfate reductase family protein n=1 Tax=Moraxella catarrhalis TaxID=480 RepID=UPI000EA8632C|nr:phosphoadenosine phosphosulfate reductase family protein [Moraxella catarrhalis]MPX54914.1 phosphoadenosine phosphosulfate reductase [Moraxella catarrhalis]MPX79065.1 phosphoadenosine phosphosulfate reductase [Moraxella catarrhalis]RKL82647.1 phosphoadenosine phosphosulfate reductase [Moraxella catarrhalis]RKM00305.1 phosphoadenosine phosphosulfate reductase [Moraxella catarrhalis]RKM34550.1 phosphoadenosine phosphosulfate reductase [Moraxella catarrhalis]
MPALSGIETIKEVAKRQNKSLLAFSCGKDAVATWLAIREHFDEIVPYYLYLVPDLEFVNESIDYYERYFGTKIVQLPHPSVHRMLNNFVFQPPQNCKVIEQAGLPDFDYLDIQAVMCERYNLPKKTLVADGVRAADSPMRRVAINTHGSISYKQLKYHPIWDWKKADLVECFKKHNVKLAVDYKIFGRSFDGIDLRFLYLIREHFPRDYQKILNLYPLADLEVFRWECANVR